MTAQILEIAGQRMAVLPIADYERLIGIVEDRVDVSAAIAAEIRRGSGEEYLPAAMVDRLLAGENPLLVWRQHRGLTRVGLADLSGLDSHVVSSIEGGDCIATEAQRKALADALGIAADDLLVA